MYITVYVSIMIKVGFLNEIVFFQIFFSDFGKVKL